MKDPRDRLTGDMLDRILSAVERIPPPVPEPRLIWTAKAIGRRVGRSADWVRLTMSKMPGSPARKVGGEWCAEENALLRFVGKEA